MPGPIMLDVAGLVLDQSDREILKHPAIGGVILFSRNYASIDQVRALTGEIKSIRSDILISVDHEGGRVQRFRQEFTQIPPMRLLGDIYDHSPEQSCQLACDIGWLIAVELQSVGIDFSFTPVLDLDTGFSEVIGDRAFHHSAEIVTELATALISGLREGGCAAVGKHFPGHGGVSADSHTEIPIDQRDLDQLSKDILPFEKLIESGLDSIMPAHVIYEKNDSSPAGFSRYWLQEQLRTRLNFNGAIISDDLSMKGASAAGNIVDRVKLALEMGCDMLLICNDRAAVEQVLAQVNFTNKTEVQQRLAKMRARTLENQQMLKQSARYLRVIESIKTIQLSQ